METFLVREKRNSSKKKDVEDIYMKRKMRRRRVIPQIGFQNFDGIFAYDPRKRKDPPPIVWRTRIESDDESSYLLENREIGDESATLILENRETSNVPHARNLQRQKRQPRTGVLSNNQNSMLSEPVSKSDIGSAKSSFSSLFVSYAGEDPPRHPSPRQLPPRSTFWPPLMTITSIKRQGIN